MVEPNGRELDYLGTNELFKLEILAKKTIAKLGKMLQQNLIGKIPRYFPRP